MSHHAPLVVKVWWPGLQLLYLYLDHPPASPMLWRSDKGHQLLLQDIGVGAVRTDPGSNRSLWDPASLCSLPLYTSFPVDFEATASDVKTTGL